MNKDQGEHYTREADRIYQDMKETFTPKNLIIFLEVALVRAILDTTRDSKAAKATMFRFYSNVQKRYKDIRGSAIV
jgi:hypothetical protein